MCYVKSCNRKGNVKLSYTNREYCDKHFAAMIERRVRKYLRQKSIDIKKEHTIIMSHTKEYRLARILLKNIYGTRLRIRPVQRGGSNKCFVPTNLDREIRKGMLSYLKNKPFENTQGVRILENVLDEELMQMARIHKIPGKKEDQVDIVQEVDYKHLIKFALKNSLDMLKS